MTLGALAKGSMAAALLPIVMASSAPARAETGEEPSVGVSSTPGSEASTAEPQALQAARRQARLRQQARGYAAEVRMQGFAKGLKLDPAQQAKVRQILLAQREAIRRLSSSPSGQGVSRVAAIRAINERTTERIRGVLNDEQRKLYRQRMPDDYAATEQKPNVEEWLKAMRAKTL